MNREPDDYDARFPVLGLPALVEATNPSGSDHELKDCRLQIQDDNNQLLLTLECNHCLKSFDSPEKFAAHLQSEHQNEVANTDQTDPNEDIPDVEQQNIDESMNTPDINTSTIQTADDTPISDSDLIEAADETTTASLKLKGDVTDVQQSASPINWEDCYVVSVDCKICGEHFEDRKMYYDHLQGHFDSDPSKTWRECDCGRKWKESRSFMLHLCGSHGYPRLFQCILTCNGTPCDFSASARSGMTKHLQNKHGMSKGNGRTNQPIATSKGNKHKRQNLDAMHVDKKHRAGIQQHPLHHHPLSLVQRSDFDSLICDLCSKEFDGRSWNCTEGCDFDICRECIAVSDVDESAENEDGIDRCNPVTTDSPTNADSLSIESIDITNERPRRRRRRKRKRIEHEAESERDHSRRAIQKQDQDSDLEDEVEDQMEQAIDYKSLYKATRNLRCAVCDQRIRSHPEFIEHMKVKHDELTPYHCHLCSNKYTLRNSLMDHYKDKHEKKTERFQCEGCQRTFNRESEWLHHQEQKGHSSVLTEITEIKENSVSNDSGNANADEVSSRIWERWTADEVNILKRMKQRGKTNEEIASELNRSAEGIRGKWRGMQKNDDRNDDDQDMEQENEKNTNEETDTPILQCRGQDVDPQYSISSETDLEQDAESTMERNEHDQDESVDPMEQPEESRLSKALRCDECNKRFKIHKEFTKHMRAEHNEWEPYKCHLCTAQYETRWELMRHYKTKQKTQGHGKYQCAVCKLSFNNTAEWLFHQSQTAHSSALTEINETADNVTNAGPPETVQNVEHDNSTSIDSQITDSSIPMVPIDVPECTVCIEESDEDLAEDIQDMEHENVHKSTENPTIDIMHRTTGVTHPTEVYLIHLTFLIV